MDIEFSKWFPVASTSDLPYRHIFQAQLLGREYAIWRADDGHVNIWENRCLHRGVRLSIGINEGSELKCQYHGWRYANRTAGCTYIPAHPADAPARTICNNTYQSQEKYGMIWTCETPDGTVPEIEGFGSYTVLRPIPINSSYKTIENFLTNVGIPKHQFVKSKSTVAWQFKLESGTQISFFIQPQNNNISILRGIYSLHIEGAEKIKILKHYNSIMVEIRDKLEKQDSPQLPDLEPKISQVSDQLSKIPVYGNQNQRFHLRVTVTEKVRISDNIIKLKLKSIKEQLPTFHAGAHIDIQLQNGLIRQYSLTNGPGETDHYCIAVKIEKNGGGGSKTIGENIAIGDVIAISSPHNSFPLLRNSKHTIFVAGGIGITPLLSMAKALHSMKLSFEFHYFTQSQDLSAFQNEIYKLGKNTNTYIDLTIDQTLSKIEKILETPSPLNKVYVCGPGEMIENTIKIGNDSGWNESNLRYEYFKNNNKIDNDSTFQIELARSAISLNVPSGKSILEVLTENGIKLESSCEQGACGTCKVSVLEGDINHQDVYLNSSEKRKGKVILTCVSRAKSDRLILDI
ncbi:MAG: Rieske 2Fe-2S domain-containing protein [Paracoccaceae bacterium]|nr:Rieske 2Fe-2S domain-containing protein [Paracoccaceae bacterium]